VPLKERQNLMYETLSKVRDDNMQLCSNKLTDAEPSPFFDIVTP